MHHNAQVWGGRQPSPQEMRGGVWGAAAPPGKINYLMSVSVRFGICFGSVGFALKPYMKPTLVQGSSLASTFPELTALQP